VNATHPDRLASIPVAQRGRIAELRQRHTGGELTAWRGRVPGRARNALIGAGITPRDAARMTDELLDEIPGIGGGGVTAIRLALADMEDPT